MNRRFIILVFTAIIAFAFSDNSQSKENISFVHEHSLDEINEISFNEDSPESEYGIPRQNSYTSPSRTAQVAKRPLSTGQQNISLAVKAGKNLDSKVYLHTLALRQCDFSGKFRTQRRLISLRKLVI